MSASSCSLLIRHSPQASPSHWRGVRGGYFFSRGLAFPPAGSTRLLAERPGVDKPTYKLYSVHQAGAVSIVGSLLATGLLLATNARRLGRPAQARQCLTVGVVGTILIIALSTQLPPQASGYAFLLVTVLVARAFARKAQGETLEQHKAADGQLESLWKAAGVAFGALMAELLVTTAVVMAVYP